MRRRAAALAKAVDKVVRQVAIVADRQIVLATPVDTGRARSNWIVTVGAPTTTPIEPYSPTSMGGTSESANLSGALGQANTAISKRKFGQTIWIQNNVPYIGRLNEGSSKQAPANFVGIGVQQAVAIVAKANRLTRI